MIILSSNEAIPSKNKSKQRRITPEKWVIDRTLRHWWLLLIAFLGSVTAIAMYSLGAVQIGQLIEGVINKQIGLIQLQQMCLALVVILGGRGLVALIGSLAAQTLAERLERDVRDELFTNLIAKSQTFHNRQKTGDLMARTTNDVSALSGMVYPGSTMILDSVVNALMPLIAITLLDVRLLAMPVIFLLLFGLSMRRYSKALDQVSGMARWRFGALNAKVAEAINAFEAIKAARQEAHTEQQILKIATEYRSLLQQQGRMQGSYLPTLIYGICFALGVGHALLLGSEGLKLGIIVGFIGLFGQLRYPMSISSYSFWLLSWGRSAVERIQKVLEAEAELTESANGQVRPLQGNFKFDQIALSLEHKTVLNNINLEIRAGETLALVGPTGSGKTLLSQLLNRTYDPSAGRLLIDGLEARDWEINSLRSQIAVIEQDVFLFARTVAENIAFGKPGATEQEIKDAARMAQADEFIQKLPNKYQTIIGERGVTLSGGQRQRLAIARALLVNTPVLILDDATSAIDSVTEELLQSAIRTAAIDRTTVVITNRISQVQWADRIVLFERGQIIAQGTHQELLEQSELYRKLFATTAIAEVSQ
jgi:ATP-binding cassette, subfamily B, bacterial